MKKQLTNGQKKVKKVMKEFKKGELNIGKSKKKVKSRKQAIAIALSEAGMSKKRKKR
jgi:exonuclease VII small subunit